MLRARGTCSVCLSRDDPTRAATLVADMDACILLAHVWGSIKEKTVRQMTYGKSLKRDSNSASGYDCELLT